MPNQSLRFSTGDVVNDYRCILDDIRQLPIPPEFIRGEWDVDSVIDFHLSLREAIDNKLLTLPELQEIEHALFTTPFSKEIIEPMDKNKLSYTVLKPGQSIEKYIKLTQSHNKLLTFDTMVIIDDGARRSFKIDDRTLNLYWLSIEALDQKQYEVVIIPEKEPFMTRLKKLI